MKKIRHSRLPITLESSDRLTPDMLKAAAAGKVEFLIDQQQYLQGYLPIAIFAQYMRWGTMPAGVVMTGPGFVTPDNASKVIKWAAQGYR